MKRYKKESVGYNLSPTEKYKMNLLETICHQLNLKYYVEIVTIFHAFKN